MELSEQFESLGIDVSHNWVADEVYSKRVTVPAGRKLTQHVHPHDHASALVRGTVVIEVDGVTREITGPAMLMIQAGKEHSITALTDVVWHCLWLVSFSEDPEEIDRRILLGGA